MRSSRRKELSGVAGVQEFKEAEQRSAVPEGLNEGSLARSALEFG
jgi:hypothetical protein